MDSSYSADCMGDSMDAKNCMTEQRAIELNNTINELLNRPKVKRTRNRKCTSTPEHKLNRYLDYFACSGETREETLERIKAKGNTLLIKLLVNIK